MFTFDILNNTLLPIPIWNKRHLKLHKKFNFNQAIFGGVEEGKIYHRYFKHTGRGWYQLGQEKTDIRHYQITLVQLKLFSLCTSRVLAISLESKNN